MGKKTDIEWCDSTFNPWWGCQKVSPGCAHCYAEVLAKRTGNDSWGNKPRKFFDDLHWAKPLHWNQQAAKLGVPRRVFCASMADLLEDRPDLEAPRNRVIGMIEETPWLDWLILTKRPENIRRMLPRHLPANVWLGTSAENQTYWDLRVRILLETEATVRFVSAEPLLGPIRMNGLKPEWLVVGGESGANARPIQKEWVENLERECEETAFFFKQWGGRNKKAAGRELNGTVWNEFPATTGVGRSPIAGTTTTFT